MISKAFVSAGIAHPSIGFDHQVNFHRVSCNPRKLAVKAHNIERSGCELQLTMDAFDLPKCEAHFLILPRRFLLEDFDVGEITLQPYNTSNALISFLVISAKVLSLVLRAISAYTFGVLSTTGWIP